MTYTMALFILLAVTVLGLLFSSSTTLARASYRAGQRTALKGAIKLVEMRQDVATALAPRGKLAVGLLRAGEAHAIEMDLRDELRRIE
jgi:hypothetical protein